MRDVLAAEFGVAHFVDVDFAQCYNIASRDAVVLTPSSEC